MENGTLTHCRSHKAFVLGAGGVLLAVLALWAWRHEWFSGGLSPTMVEAWVDQAGPWGPILVVVLMVIAVVASPVPSAPIAIASGAAFGHTMGTALVALGSEIGALIAFLIARQLGYDALRRRFGARIDMGLIGSQNFLMLTVFGSRLLPFVSFDLVSYAAGLSSITFWRFAVATFAGILPASFVLAHLGSEMMASDVVDTSAVVFGLGLLVALPVLWVSWRRTSSVDDDEHGSGTSPNSISRCHQ